MPGNCPDKRIDRHVALIYKIGFEFLGRMNQQPPMHQLAVLSTGWGAFFHLVLDGVHHSPFLFAVDHYTFFFFFFGSWPFFPWI